jgi:hypothetical protein
MAGNALRLVISISASADSARSVAQRLLISLPSVCLGLSARLCPNLAHRIPTHLDPMGVVDQAVEDAIGQSGITNLFVPDFNWCLS